MESNKTVLVVKKSPYGFMVEGIDDWLKCDKNFIKSETFKNLKAGDKIQIIKENKAGFITDIITSELFTKNEAESIHTAQTKTFIQDPASFLCRHEYRHFYSDNNQFHFYCVFCLQIKTIKKD